MPPSVTTALIKPVSEKPGEQHRERVLFVLLLGIVALTLLSFAVTLYDSYRLGSAYTGLAPHRFIAVPFVFIGLYVLAKIGQGRVASTLLIATLYLLVTQVAYRWGVNLPTALLAYALILTLTGILLGSRAVFLLLAGVALTLATLNQLQTMGIAPVETYWRTESITHVDVTMYVALMTIIVLVGWLYNREIERALASALNSENALKKERDLLEEKVAERTEELKRTQLEKMLHMYRFAEFGRLASGFLHDLVNPLNTVSLNLEELKANGGTPTRKMINNTKLIQRALAGTKQVEQFVTAARNQIKEESEQSKFSVVDELHQVIQILEHKAKEADVALTILVEPQNLHLYNDPVKFNQMITNLVSNAIDSYYGLNRKPKKHVDITVEEQSDTITLTVQDQGCGIKAEFLDKIFEPLYTSKVSRNGMGLGLAITKDIVDHDFSGQITVTSTEKNGSTFVITIPKAIAIV